MWEAWKIPIALSGSPGPIRQGFADALDTAYVIAGSTNELTANHSVDADFERMEATVAYTTAASGDMTFTPTATFTLKCGGLSDAAHALTSAQKPWLPSR